MSINNKTYEEIIQALFLINLGADDPAEIDEAPSCHYCHQYSVWDDSGKMFKQNHSADCPIGLLKKNFIVLRDTLLSQVEKE